VWPDHASVSNKVRTLAIVVGSDRSLNELKRGVTDLQIAWRACGAMRDWIIKHGVEVNAIHAASAIHQILLPQAEALGDVGEALLSWDGLGNLPKVVWPVGHVPDLAKKNSVASTFPKYKDWIYHYREEFRQRMGVELPPG
jgi:hypothetical protein